MKPYADAPARRFRQIVADLLCVAWIGWWIWSGISLYTDTMDLTKPVNKAEQASTALGDNFRQTAKNLGNIPLIGESAARPLRDAADNADQVAVASAESESSIEGLAFWGGLSIALVPIMLAGAFYIAPRIRFARTGAAYLDYLAQTGDLDLIALKALTRRDADQIAGLHPDPVRAWRMGDPDLISALAGLELRDAGLHKLAHEKLTDERKVPQA